VIITRLRAVGCVFAEDEAELLITAARTPAELAVMVDRRASGLPIEHVLGWAEFCGMRIAVDPGVFVPRRRTEFLVRVAADLAGQVLDGQVPGRQVPGRQLPGRQVPGRQVPGQRRVVIVDLCCGSGAVGAALTAALSGTGIPSSTGIPAAAGTLAGAELHAVDIDPAAVRCARRNIAAAGGEVYEGDLYEPLPVALRGRVDFLVANVPYVPTGDIGLLPPEAREHEARVALDGGADGLDVLRRVAAAAPQWLAPGGCLLSETSERQAPLALAILARSELIPRVASCPDLNATVVLGTRPKP
jgi:release factor glutamine methyltransferase